MKPTKMLRWVVLTSLGTLAACGGVSDIGSGDEDPMGKAGDGSGNGTGVGGSSSMGAYPSMGAKPGTPGGGSSSVGGGMPSPTTECMVDFDCEPSDPFCQICDDGGYVCPKAFCAAGKCVEDRPTCNTKCLTEKDCPVLDIACTDCGDGTQACPTTECVMNQCQTFLNGCGNIDPCQGAPCGAECKSCGPDGMCAPDVVSYCSAEGKCQPGLPQCANPGMCQDAKDCGEAPPNCVACGNDTCAEFSCLQGKCVFSCPPAPDPQCMTSEDCGPIDAVCKLCPSGKCAVQACLEGSCQMVCLL